MSLGRQSRWLTDVACSRIGASSPARTNAPSTWMNSYRRHRSSGRRIEPSSALGHCQSVLTSTRFGECRLGSDSPASALILVGSFSVDSGYCAVSRQLRRAPTPDLHADTGLCGPAGMTCSTGHKLENRHAFGGAADVTSSVMTLKPASVHGPNEVTIATSVASHPRAIKMRPIRGSLRRASNVYQRPPR